MLGRNLAKSTPRLLLSTRNYSIKDQGQKVNSYIKRIGDEKTRESQATIKAVRMLGAGTVIVVLCSLLWTSTLSAPVKEKTTDYQDLSKDVRRN